MKITNISSIICCLILCSCSHVTTKSTFDLSSSDFDNNINKYHKKPIQLLVLEPNSTKFYDSENIIVKNSLNSLAYLGSSQWADRLPSLVQNRLIESFENSHLFKAVDRPGQRMVFNYELITNIRDFNICVLDDNNIEAKITIDAKLLDEHTGKVKATHIFSKKELLTNVGYKTVQLSPTDYAFNLDKIFKNLTKEIILWVQKYS